MSNENPLEAYHGITRNLDHPPFGERESMLLSISIWAGGMIWLYFSSLSGWRLLAAFLVITVVAAVGGLYVSRASKRYFARRKAADDDEDIAMQQAERDRRIAEAKASGAFDRFGPRD
ncbi:MAG: hypothetical protein HUJ24_06110 [Rhodobacteraceae bacterium]|nr:hypothetical protein [Paracoccaceae bacterium]